MAKIPVYDNPITGLRPTETGVEATAQAARRSGAFFNQAAKDLQQFGQETANQGTRLAGMVKTTIEDAGRVAVDYAEHQEISHGAAAFAGLNDDLTNSWHQIAKNADPNDPTVAQNFRTLTEQKLTDFKSGFLTEGGQKWAEGRIEALRTHTFEKTAADMATLAGAAAHVNARQTVNHLSNTAMIDPSSVPELLRNVDATVGAAWDSSPNLKGAASAAERTKLIEASKEAIVKAGAIGAIRSSSNPEAAAKAWSENPEYSKYINGAEVKQLADAARTQLRYIHAENRANEAEQRRADTERFHQAANALEISTTRVNKTTGAVEPVTPQGLREKLTELSLMPHADPGRIAALVRRAEEVGVKTDETTQRNLAIRSRATQADLYSQVLDNRVVSKKTFQEAYLKGDLTWEAKNQLERDFDADHSATGEKIATRRTEYLKSHEGELDPARMVANLRSAAGSVAIDKAGQALRAAEEDLRKGGKDPQSLYQYDKDGHSQADMIINGFRVPLSALPSNLQTMLGVTPGSVPVPGAPPTPPVLKGIAALGWSPSLKLFFDQTTGDRYRPDGTKVTK